MSLSPQEKAARFLALHEAPGTFVIPNPWDVGSALLLAGLGFPALATSSAASAMAAGRRDGKLGRDAALSHARLLAAAVDLPVSADLENGFGDAPETVAETIRLAAEAGLAGCTIEDSTGNPAQPLYDETLAVERIAAAVEAARGLPFPFLLTARAHNFLYPGGKLDATLRRLQAYDRAGAGVLMAPALPDLESVRTVCASVTKPVNFMAGITGKSFSVPELAAAGVKRISLATAPYRIAMTALLEAAREIQSGGSLEFVDRCAATPELCRIMGI